MQLGVFTGLGKTYFCQHHLGWYEIDEFVYLKNNNFIFWDDIIKHYATCGYNIVTTISPATLQYLSLTYPDTTIILPENTDEARTFVLENIVKRSYDPGYAKFMLDNYDKLYSATVEAAKKFKNVIFVPAGKYLSDVLKDLGISDE